MNLPTTYKVDISKPLLPTPLQSMLVSGDAEANVIILELYDGETPFSPGGSCVGMAVRQDGVTAPITGAVNGNTMSAVLPAEAYAIPGAMNLIIKNVNGNVKTSLFFGCGNVLIGETGTVIDPGTIIPSVTDLLQRIDEAVDSIPADYTALLASIAPDFADLSFPVSAGTYAWYNGTLYSAAADIPASEAWTPSHWKAAVMGDELTGLKSALGEAVIMGNWDNVPLTLGTSGYYDLTGVFHAEGNRKNATVSVIPGEKYKLNTFLRSTLIPAVEFFNGATHVSNLKPGTGTNEKVVDYKITVPSGVDTMIVQNADTTGDDELSLKKYNTGKELQVYTKSETNALLTEMPKKYGVKWDIDDPDDLGQRCFNAVGLSATIGVGSTNGSSDFDTIYPWSEMKRCNIKQNANGAKIVTFEGETGFALDGSNGDVFVRIPKFYYERYRDNGYEYRVISATGNNPHPAFVENGAVLDEIFVGAFEGYINNNALASMAGVIPTSNEVGQTFLTAAQNKGDGYTLYDMRCVDAVWTLMAIEYGCRNTNRILGYGYADFLQAVNTQYGVVCDTAATATNVFSASKDYSAARIGNMPVGSSIVICKGTQQNCITFAKLTGVTSDANHWYLAFDGVPVDLDTTCFIGSAGCFTNFCETVPSGALSWHTGRANWQSGSNTKNPVRYRWIENIIGSLWAFLPDITFRDLQMYQCKNIKDYVMFKHISPYLPIGSTYTENTNNGEKADVAGANYWITELNHDIFAKGVDFGRAYDKTLTSTKAFGAYYYLSGGTRCIVNGGGFDHLYRCNVLTNRAWVDETEKWYLYGARLIYKNVE